MAGFCIPPKLAKTLKAAAVAGEINMAELYDMTSEQRRTRFEKFAPKETAVQINAGFEQSMVSSQKDSLKKWVESTFTGKEKKAKSFPDVLKKIDSLEELGVINPATAESFMEDLVATKLGVNVTQAEVEGISKRAKKIQEIGEKGETDKFGLPSMEYFKARKDMQSYLNSLNPTSKTRVLTSTIFRSNLLLGVKTATTNIVGNTVQGLFTALEKRLATGQFKGYNGNLVKDYAKNAVKIHSETGYDVTRMTSIGETFTTLGEKIQTSEGPGKLRKIGRFYEDVVFKKMLGTPDVAFSAMQFADTVNLASTQTANREGLKGDAAKARAKELFLEATKIEPSVDNLAAVAIKEQGIMDAKYATYQQESKYAEVAMGIRQTLNNATGDVRLGDLLMPFVKTPANVVGASLDASGVSAIRALYNMPEALSQMKKGNKAPIQKVIRDGVRSGLGLTVAFIITSSIDDDEFMGEYPTSQKEKELLELRNATPNSIKLGGKWVSLDYFGPLGSAVKGIMYAKKYGETPQDQLLQMVMGGVETGASLPGVDVIHKAISDARAFAPGGDATLGEIGGEFGTSVASQLSSRLIPSIIGDLAKTIDPLKRQVDYDDPFSILKAKIPGLREQLPARENIFGETIKTEGLSQILFGARVKTANESAVISELGRLDEAGQLPSITDAEKTSSRVKGFKAQVSAEKYDKTIDRYQVDLLKAFEKTISSRQYERASNEEKKEMLNKVKSDTLNRALTRGGYRKPR